MTGTDEKRARLWDAEAMLDRVGELVHHAIAFEFAIKGAGLDLETYDPILLLAQRHTDEVRKLRDDLEDQEHEAKRGSK